MDNPNSNEFVKQQRLIALGDQAWAALAAKTNDIVRIATSGPECERDNDIVKMVLCVMAGKLLHDRDQKSDGG